VTAARNALIIAAAIIAAALSAFYFWPPPAPSPDSPVAAFNEFGEKSAASLIGVQPFLTPADYQSPDALRRRLGAYLEAAKEHGWITDKTIVIFPEHIGTWLVAARAPAYVYAAHKTANSMPALIASDPIAFARAWSNSTEEDRAAAAIFRMRQRSMLKDYQEVFGGLAKDYGVTVVAGSIVAENPHVESGSIKSAAGALYNMSAVFTPDGAASPDLVLKAYPIPSEKVFTAAAAPEDIPVFETPAGTLGVLICADSWHPAAYAALKRKGAEIVAVPAFLQPDGAWENPWRGYVTPWPDDVSREAPETISEGEAWLSYSMPWRAQGAGASAGMTVFLRGQLWDLGSAGRTLALTPQGLMQGDIVDGAAISVLWL